MRVYSLLTKIIAVTSVMVAGFFFMAPHASAATLTVNSKADSAADDGSCTLREAITAANTDTASGALSGECIAGSGADTINFNITGTSDFTNGGQPGYTIQPTSGLPSITDTVNIDGYTQPGAQANTAIAPNPLNGRLLIEIDGGGAGVNFFDFDTGSNNSTLKGLIINNTQGGALNIIGVSGITIQGNYIGTDPTGLIANPTGTDNVSSSVAVNIGDFSLLATDTSTTNTLIGGINPSERNIISGNYGGAFGVAGVDTEFYGNYIGLGTDGLTTLSNSTGTGVTTGVLTMDYADGVQIGNGQNSGMNIISGNTRGIQPDYSTDIEIVGNRIGTDYTGTLARPNLRNGISLGLGTNNVRIGGSNSGEGNIISNNTDNGIDIWTTGTRVSNVLIEGNAIIGNTGNGIIISGGTDNTVRNNVISDNDGLANIALIGMSGAVIENNVVQGNKIGTKPDGTLDNTYTQGPGILLNGLANKNLIGGPNPGDGNIIAGNNVAGILVLESAVTGIGTFTSTGNSILGNSIVNSDSGNFFGFPFPGLGIDLAHFDINGSFVPQSVTSDGPTPNDSTDADTGPNNYMNFPVLNSATQNNNQLTVDLNLDAADTTDTGGNYRVEFFASDTADSSGYGEGQTYLGSANIANGNNQTATITLPANINLTGKVLSATTTAMNNATPSGFGSTSEFSEISPITVLSTTTPDQLASTGENLWLWLVGALSLVGVGAYMLRVVGRR